jgi:hypothetical protein
VTASAAFPVLIRPLRLEDRRATSDRLVLLGDGGIYDNLGVEALLQRLLRVLETEGYPGALLVVVDAERPYKFGEGLRLLQVIHALAEARARTLSRLLLELYGGGRGTARRIAVVTLRLRDGGTTAAERSALARIPTAFRIRPEHQRLVTRAAGSLVARERPALVRLATELAR